jgi:hypothetical protein
VQGLEAPPWPRHFVALAAQLELAFPANTAREFINPSIYDANHAGSSEAVSGRFPTIHKPGNDTNS